MTELVFVRMMMMIGVRGQFVDCQLVPPPVNKTGATALPHMGIGVRIATIIIIIFMIMIMITIVMRRGVKMW